MSESVVVKAYAEKLVGGAETIFLDPTPLFYTV